MAPFTRQSYYKYHEFRSWSRYAYAHSHFFLITCSLRSLSSPTRHTCTLINPKYLDSKDET
ncbi:hypothetical protein BCR33DRAFT_724880 [Rhizoclosmatium globosum]|uniref:Uncharacterized protein n=1 Tax=Rhizoclosmatium globosum TaxID=329046 RepID=A0A1Y2B349_9FUNG|nr:hypothetical protein BCR33DRAFT_724880 [Rhizoclosmatium globosum]|eukprot:ORY28917.1 hypothetical protein BCR33DRAFT_724880 [Rhizoclosmatium globosum]